MGQQSVFVTQWILKAGVTRQFADVLQQAAGAPGEAGGEGLQQPQVHLLLLLLYIKKFLLLILLLLLFLLLFSSPKPILLFCSSFLPSSPNSPPPPGAGS